MDPLANDILVHFTPCISYLLPPAGVAEAALALANAVLPAALLLLPRVVESLLSSELKRESSIDKKLSSF